MSEIEDRMSLAEEMVWFFMVFVVFNLLKMVGLV